MTFLVATRSPVGEWLSLVEHLVRDQGVGGSNPLSPTNLFRYTPPFAVGCIVSHPFGCAQGRLLQKAQGWGSLYGMVQAANQRWASRGV